VFGGGGGGRCCGGAGRRLGRRRVQVEAPAVRRGKLEAPAVRRGQGGTTAGPVRRDDGVRGSA
jgi:hypothetical protein